MNILSRISYNTVRTLGTVYSALLWVWLIMSGSEFFLWGRHRQHGRKTN